jgi:cell division protein FtsQ
LAEAARIPAEPTPAAEGPGTVRRLLRLFGALVLLGLVAAGGEQLMRWEPLWLPIRVVTVEGEVERMSRDRLQRTVVEHLEGGILSQDLRVLKDAVEAMPWVRSASLARVWPDRLELTVEEHVPLARWGEDALVTDDGVVFRPDPSERPDGLPALAGRDEQAPAVVTAFLGWRARLAALGLGLAAVDLDARGAWSLRTADGVTVELGKAEAEIRIARFLTAWPSLVAAGQPGTVDLRYSNGLAVTWAEPPDSPAAGDQPKTAGAGAPGWIRPRNRS